MTTSLEHRTDLDDRTLLDGCVKLSPAVSLRPEPFGALAYHFGNRRLSFLRHPDMVAVVKTVGDHPSLRAALEANNIEPRRWRSFVMAIRTILESEMLTIEPRPQAGTP